MRPWTAELVLPTSILRAWRLGAGSEVADIYWEAVGKGSSRWAGTGDWWNGRHAVLEPVLIAWGLKSPRRLQNDFMVAYPEEISLPSSRR
jgi:hypothetical protein